MEFCFFKTSMPDSRKADFYLECMDGSVFIDFNRKKNLIFLARISFDGYGCCNLTKAKSFNKEESFLFIEEMEKHNLNQEIITKLVKRAIKINIDYIWNDALVEYGFV